jgi:4-amino-4-deoxychorismate lyase
MREYLYFDKELVVPQDLNRSLMFGEGAFETFRYKQKLPVHLNRHLLRLKNTCNYLDIKYPGDFYIETTIEKMVKDHKSEHFNNVIKDLIVKIALFSSGGPSYFDKSENTITCVSIKEEDSVVQKTISLGLSKLKVNSKDVFNFHKTTNYLLSSIERKTAKKNNFDDSLLINENNIVVESTSGNFFWIKGSNVFTPSIETGALPGITRGLVLEVCKKNKIRVVEDEFEPGSIIFPEAMFITNSARGIIEVSNLNNTTESTRTQNLFPIIKNDLLQLLDWT